MAENLVIIGAGGFAREVLDLIDRDYFTPIGFIDNATNIAVDELALPILGDDSLIPELRKRGIANHCVVAIGDPKIRKKLFELCLNCDIVLPPIVDKSAVIYTQHKILAGTIIYPGAIVMTNCRLGRACLINSGATLGHDLVLGDFCNINPGAHLAGRISIGHGSSIGIGSSIREQISIGDDVIIGAGSVVVKNIPSGSLAFGVPARVQGIR